MAKVNESKLKFGSKVEVTENPMNDSIEIGHIGYLTKTTLFHRTEAVKDKDNQYWIDGICVGSPGNPVCFKVLKY